MSRFRNRTKALALELLSAGTIGTMVLVPGCTPNKNPAGTDIHNQHNPERCLIAPDLPGCDKMSPSPTPSPTPKP